VPSEATAFNADRSGDKSGAERRRRQRQAGEPVSRRKKNLDGEKALGNEITADVPTGQQGRMSLVRESHYATRSRSSLHAEAPTKPLRERPDQSES
jgi:hypothetical protein